MTVVDLQALDAWKAKQKEGWASFAALEPMTTPPAAQLVRFAGVRSGQQVLDVACGTGVVALTAATRGARATGLDMTPELIQRARENSQLCALEIDWHEGDAEELPFKDREFDVVLSQYGHMFAPRPEVAVAEMLRVLKPGGTIAFSTWPPELFLGRVFQLVSRYLPPPPPGVSPPWQWGDPNIVRERLGSAVKDLVFDRADLLFPTFNPKHQRQQVERNTGPVRRLVEMLDGSDPAKLESFRREYEALVSEYFADNLLRQGYLMTRAIKV